MCLSCRNIYQHKDNFLKIENHRTELISGCLNNTPNPLVSIIITVYKRKEYIHEAIKSAIHQKNISFDYEIIVLCDDPEAKLQEFDTYRNIKNIFIYRNRGNIGLYNNVNFGVQIARGRYVAFLHDDDILYPEYLSEIKNFLSNRNHEPKCVLVNRNVTGLLVQQSILKKTVKLLLSVIFSPFFLFRFLFRKPYKKLNLREGLTYILSNIYKAPSCGTLFERKVFLDSGGFNQDFWPVSDYYFFLKFNKDFPVYMTRKKLACYRWFDNLSQNKSVQFMGFEHLSDFFKSEQPINAVNRYYSFFHNEILYAKYLMISKEYRNEINDKNPMGNQCNKIKWVIFKLYNLIFRFFHDIII